MKHLLMATMVVCVTGCTTFTKGVDPENKEQVKGIDRHSAFPAVRRDAFEWVNFLEMIDPTGRARSGDYKKLWDDTLKNGDVRRDSSGSSAISYGARYDLVLSWFRETKEISPEDKKRRRDAIQERIMSVSTSRCNVFKTFLRRDQSDTNFLLGGLTTVSAVLGAVLQGVNASRNLAGTAGIFSGLRSEYNQSYYSNLAAHVIVKGIEVRQESVYKRIQTEGQSKGIDAYPLEAAIKDAIYFDGLCSVVAGLDQAAASVDATREPGIEAAMRTVLRARLLQEAVNTPRDKLTPDEIDKFAASGSRLGMSLVGSARSEPAPPGVDIDLYAAADLSIGRLTAAMETAAKDLDRSALGKKKTLLAKLIEDKSINADGEKALTALSPVDGELTKLYKTLLDKEIVSALGLTTNQCFIKHAAAALKDRTAATEALAKAGKDVSALEEAQHMLKLATRRLQDAHDNLRRLEQLVSTDVLNAKNAIQASIDKATMPANSKDWSSLLATAKTPIQATAATNYACK